jgi:moderate conductance mechanosensitive channel
MDLSSSLAAILEHRASFTPAAAALIARLLSVSLTLVCLLIAYRVVIRVSERVLLLSEAGRGPRFRTVGGLLDNVVRWVLVFVVLVVILRELGIDVRGLLVSAGVVGLAIGFGAQTLIRDIIAGLFMLFEGVIAVGDVVEAGGHVGTVESIGLRVTRLRLPAGSLRVVPHGQLTDFVNLSSEWALAAVEIAVPPEVDVTRALEALTRVGVEWADARGPALESPQAQGIIKFIGRDAVLRLSVRVEAARRVDTEFELRRRIKDTFDRERWSFAGTS